LHVTVKPQTEASNHTVVYSRVATLFVAKTIQGLFKDYQAPHDLFHQLWPCETVFTASQKNWLITTTLYVKPMIQ